jgi:hypothetical protein
LRHVRCRLMNGGRDSISESGYKRAGRNLQRWPKNSAVAPINCAVQPKINPKAIRHLAPLPTPASESAGLCAGVAKSKVARSLNFSVIGFSSPRFNLTNARVSSIRRPCLCLMVAVRRAPSGAPVLLGSTGLLTCVQLPPYCLVAMR